MCGIAGYSLSAASSVNRTLAAQALLAGIAERGADAVGYAYRAADGAVTVRKRRSGASELIEHLSVPTAADAALVHVRDYTKGHPTVEANNHPIRHGAVVGIHNGVIANDEQIFARYGFERAQPDMSVDSEAIFALVEHAEGAAECLEELHGALAAAWLDERLPRTLFLARGIGRPLWLGRGARELFFASTRDALEVVEQTLRTTLRKSEVDEGTQLLVEAGAVVETRRFLPDRSYVEETVLPAVRAPDESASALARLAVLAASV